MSNRLPAAAAAFATLILVSCGAPSTPDFVKRAAMGDLYEIEAGKIASEKGQSEAVKQFGQHMAEAHSKTTEELKGIVQAKKIEAKLAPRLDKRHRDMVDDLNAAKPEDFDNMYADQQVRAHKTAAELFDRYAEAGDNAALKQFAANTLPTIKQHLAEAEKLPQ